MGGGRSRGKGSGSALERLSASVGLVTVLAILGFMGWQAVNMTESPPAVTVRPGQISRTGGGYVVEITARNASMTTVADLHVEGALTQGEVEVERSEVTLSYVPAQSEARGGLIFTHDPARYRLEIRPTGYQEP